MIKTIRVVTVQKDRKHNVRAQVVKVYLVVQDKIIGEIGIERAGHLNRAPTPL